MSDRFMARLEDRLLNHPLRARLSELRAAVSNLDDEQVTATGPHSEGAVARVTPVATFIEGALAAADPKLTTGAALTALDSALAQAASTAAQLPDTPEYAANLDQHLEEALTAAYPLFASSKVIAKRANVGAQAFSTALRESVVDVSRRAGELADAQQQLDEQLRQAATDAEEAAQQREERLEATVTQLTGSLDAEKQRVDTLVERFEEQFAAGQQDREAAFKELRDELQAASSGESEKLTAAAEATAKDLSQRAEDLLTEVTEKKEQVDALYEVITDKGTAGAFHDEAKAQKTAADTWRNVAVWFGVATVAVAAISIALALLFSDVGTSASAISAKVALTLATAGIAAYAGRQSGRHREREEEAKRLELELVAFPPFIDSLDDEQKRKVRQQFADRAFRGRPVDAPRRPLLRKDDSFGVGTPELIELLVQALRRSDPPTGSG